MIEATLTWKIECNDCHKEFKETHRSDWFSNGFTDLTEEDLSGSEVIENARNDGWSFERESYEDLVPYCPTCKGK